MILDTSGLNTALASIGRNFGVPVDRTGSVSLWFAVTLAVMIPLAGWLGERFGTVRVLLAGLATLMIGSIICATAASFPMVVAGRIVQGVGAGGLVPLASSLLFRNFDPAHRLRIIAALSLPISLAPALGPLIGGLLVDRLSWRWVFLLNLPIGVLAIIGALVFAREAADRAVRRLDVRGAILATVGFGATVLGLEQLATGTGVDGILALAAGIVALAVLIPVERRAGARAFLDIALLGRRTFAKTTAITAAHSAAFIGFGLAGPLLLQTQLGLSAFGAGAISMAGALGPAVSGRIGRPFIVRVGPRIAILCSQLGMILGLGVVVLGYALVALWIIALGVFLTGSFGFFTVLACQTVGFATIPQTNLGDATTLDGTSRQLGGAIGIATVSGALAAAGGLGAATTATVALALGSITVWNAVALVILVAPGRLPLPHRPDPVRPRSES